MISVKPLKLFPYRKVIINIMDIKEIQLAIDNELKVCREDILNVADQSSLNDFKGLHLGKKSLCSSLFSKMRDVPSESKQLVGKMVVDLRQKITDIFNAKENELKQVALEKQLQKDKVDISLPGYSHKLGSKHPFYAVVDDITDFFIGLGYEVADGPEVETDYNNFEMMNIPKDHPSRDMQDSFSITDELVLRSHTSAVQARVMAKCKGVGPIKIICPGKVYRRDNDATHSHQFGQIEGLVISESATFANLLETLTLLLKHLFGEKRKVRFRPSYFPFTEPSIEADISCFECGGKGCKFCKNTGYIEILGAGMVHPNVLRLNGFDDTKYQGFAFGIGIDRVAMLKYNIDDIKRFYTNDVRFISEFFKE